MSDSSNPGTGPQSKTAAVGDGEPRHQTSLELFLTCRRGKDFVLGRELLHRPWANMLCSLTYILKILKVCLQTVCI